MLSYISSYFEKEPDSYVKEIFIHPVKSLSGISLQECEIDEFGFKYDRMYMVAEPDKKRADEQNAYRFVTQRETPELTLVKTSINKEANELVLSYAPADIRLVLPLTLPSHVIDQARRVTAWIWSQTPECVDLNDFYPEISRFFDTVRNKSDSRTTIVAPVLRRSVVRGMEQRVDLQSTQSAFQDYYPGNLICEASLQDLKQRVVTKTEGQVVIQSRNFRPNMVITNTKKAWDEDDWRRVQIGDTTWFVPCRNVRCRVTTVNLQQGKYEKSSEPLKTMMSFRRIDKGAKYGACFGMNLVQEQVGVVVRVGDPVKVLQRGEHH